MKALTVRQPWASLIALGVKRIETRTRQTKYRGPLAIHAGAAAVPRRMAQLPDGMMGDWWVIDQDGEPMLLDHRFGHGTHADLHDMPLGAVVATANLVACVPMLDLKDPRVNDFPETGKPQLLTLGDEPLGERLSMCLWETEHFGFVDVSDQHPFGWFETGRWAWILEDVKPLDRPVPAKGKLGLWEWSEAV